MACPGPAGPDLVGYADGGEHGDFEFGIGDLFSAFDTFDRDGDGDGDD